MVTRLQKRFPKVGVGLRHPHIKEALQGNSDIDFVEIHTENFFSRGGGLTRVLSDIADKYPVSLHSTAMGLASSSGIPDSYFKRVVAVAEISQPFLMSDHVCFAWGQVNGLPTHAGDLLPIPFNEETLALLSENLDRVQQQLGRQLLMENLSAYLTLPGSTMTEVEFLNELVDKTNCGLLVDLNNLLVNAKNAQAEDVLGSAKQWLTEIPKTAVGEIHLAGHSSVKHHGMVIDDHSEMVSQDCWLLFKHANQLFGAKPTLIEWDNNLPDWQVLVKEAEKARVLINEVLVDE